MLIGYARTSTLEQEAGLAAQHRELGKVGCERMFSEKVSSVGQRPQLEAALAFAREGDEFVITKLDRLARSVAHLSDIVRLLAQKQVSLRVLDIGLDTSTPTGSLMLNMLGAVAQFEREMMLERQREGIAKAKADGVYKGRKPTARAKLEQVQVLRVAGKTMSQIAAEVGISKGSVHALLSAARQTR